MNTQRERKNLLAFWRQVRKRRRSNEGLPLLRLLLVLSSISPLFGIWAIRGSNLTSSIWFEIACVTAAVLPNLALLSRLLISWILSETDEVFIGRVEDRRQDVLVYLFALVLPFYNADLSSCRELAAATVTVSIIIFLFWRLNLFYMNLVFAAFGYHVFAVHPPQTVNPLSGTSMKLLITWRSELPREGAIKGYRLFGDIIFEV